jgi:predicted MPP superfamily phosphohydrolase
LSAATQALTKLGFHDAGTTDITLGGKPGLTVQIRGNELPWLQRHASEVSEDRPAESENLLRIALSHSPDQLRWAQSHSADLMLAGHTHGGQVRLPFIGPLVAPSHFGSRFASGVFLRQNTLMHVSRGVAGTHPLRMRCMPEVSVLTIES